MKRTECKTRHKRKHAEEFQPSNHSRCRAYVTKARKEYLASMKPGHLEPTKEKHGQADGAAWRNNVTREQQGRRRIALHWLDLALVCLPYHSKSDAAERRAS